MPKLGDKLRDVAEVLELAANILDHLDGLDVCPACNGHKSVEPLYCLKCKGKGFVEARESRRK